MEKSKSNLSTYVSNYVLIIQKLGKVFLREILFSVAEPGKKKPPKHAASTAEGQEDWDEGGQRKPKNTGGF